MKKKKKTCIDLTAQRERENRRWDSERLRERAAKVAELTEIIAEGEYSCDWYLDRVKIKDGGIKFSCFDLHSDLEGEQGGGVVCVQIEDYDLAKFLQHAPKMAQLIADQQKRIKELEG